MSFGRRHIITYVSDRRRQLAIPDLAFANALGIGIDELHAYEADEVPVPATVLAAMLEFVSGDSPPSDHPLMTHPPGFGEHGHSTRGLADHRFAQSVELMRNFAAIASETDRAHILALAAAYAGRKGTSD